MRDDISRQRVEARRTYLIAVDKQRAAIVEVIDKVLAAQKLGVTWWWARDLRRYVAGETPRIATRESEVPRAWSMTQALGLKLNFSTVEDCTP